MCFFVCENFVMMADTIWIFVSVVCINSSELAVVHTASWLWFYPFIVYHGNTVLLHLKWSWEGELGACYFVQGVKLGGREVGGAACEHTSKHTWQILAGWSKAVWGTGHTYESRPCNWAQCLQHALLAFTSPMYDVLLNCIQEVYYPLSCHINITRVCHYLLILGIKPSLGDTFVWLWNNIEPSCRQKV